MPKAKEPRLTLKQKLFIQEYIKTNGNGTQSALRAYNTESAEVASSIAKENLRKVPIREELDRVLQKGELKVEHFIDQTAEISRFKPKKGFSGSDVLEANKTMLKLHGALTDKRQITTLAIKTDLEKLSKRELVELRDKKRQETDMILDGESLTEDNVDEQVDNRQPV